MIILLDIQTAEFQIIKEITDIDICDIYAIGVADIN